MSLSISDFVDVTVNVGAVAVGSVSYDCGLILLKNSDWPNTIDARTAEYGDLTEVINAGFNADVQSAVAAYFAQSPSPSKVVLGHYDTGETPTQGVAACRADNSSWYGVAIADFINALTSAQISAVAAAVESFTEPSVFFYQTTDSNCVVASSTNIMATLKTQSYNRTFGFYVDNDAYGSDDSLKNVAVAVLGRACGLNSKDANTAFALAFKNLAAVSSIDITDSQLSVLKSHNGNVYASVARGKYNFIVNGSAASGVRYDEMYCLDVLQSEIETNVTNLFASQLVVPQTDAGVSMIVAKISEACSTVVDIGFIAPGIWTGPNVKDLRTGDAMPAGYVIMHDSISEQSQAERENRIAPTMYVCIKLAGGVEFVAVVVNVNR